MNGPRVTVVLGALVVAMSIAILAAYGTDEAGKSALIRATARTSLVLFLAAFAASSVRVFVKNAATAWLLKNRRYLGLSFVVSHAIHLAAIADVAVRWPHPFMEQSAQPLTLIGGGAGYVGLVLMALTSWDGAVRRLGAKRWRVLHLVGSWLLWIIFAQSYAGRAVAAPWPYALVMVAVVGVAVLRFAAWRRKRST
jgi:methionine sulfoxide reductase heme-binding subunit